MTVNHLMEDLADLHVEWRHGETPGVYTVHLMTLFGGLMQDVEKLLPHFVDMDCCRKPTEE